MFIFQLKVNFLHKIRTNICHLTVFARTCTTVLIGTIAQLDFHTMTLSIGYCRDRAYFTTTSVCPYPTSAISPSLCLYTSILYFCHATLISISEVMRNYPRLTPLLSIACEKKMCCNNQRRIQDFPGGGRQLPRGGRQHTILPNFPKNCMKSKEFGRPGGGGARPLRPP